MRDEKSGPGCQSCFCEVTNPEYYKIPGYIYDAADIFQDTFKSTDLLVVKKGHENSEVILMEYDITVQ